MNTGLVLEPLPTGAWAFLAATFAVFSKTLPFTAVFSAFCNDVIWLIVVSFFFAAVSSSGSICHCSAHVSHAGTGEVPQSQGLPSDVVASMFRTAVFMSLQINMTPCLCVLVLVT